MINIIWVALTVIGILFAVINGTMEEVNEAIFKGASDAVTLCIGLISVLVFWLGIMKIAEHAGLLEKLAIYSTYCNKTISGNSKESSSNGVYFV